MQWEVYPAGLYLLLKTYHERYGLPLYVTENGAAFEGEPPATEGVIDDWSRVRYLQSHIEMAHRAISEGVLLRGYLVWTLLDNFEWAFGYSKRFGIVHCNHRTLERTMKRSAYWYGKVINDNGV